MIENTVVNAQSTVIEKKKRLVYKLSSQRELSLLKILDFKLDAHLK